MSPKTPSRAENLRLRCLERKRTLAPRCTTLARAQSLARTKDLPWLNLRWGNKVKDVLESLAFLVDDGELLAGHIRPVSHEVCRQEDAQAAPLLAGFPPIWGQTGHAEPDYGKLLRVGISGLLAECAERAAELDEADPEQQQKQLFYQSVTLALTGLSGMIQNAASAAESARAAATEPVRRAELETMAAVCRHVAAEPPRTFHEAIQLLWFAELGIEVGDEAGLIAPGHLDRSLWPFYQADLAAGRITPEHALELLECLYLLVNETIPDGLAVPVMVGGRDIAGNDLTNALSYLCLEALRRTRLVYPTVGVCWHAGTPPALTTLATELVAKGYPTPAFFGDEVIQRGLRGLGTPPADACQYINSTCVEITPVGASNVWVASPYFNVCGLLLESIEQQAAVPPATFTLFLDRYYQLLGDKIRAAVIEQNVARETRCRFMARPLQSALTRDCLARGLDIEQGGALYNWVECSFVGVANLADSLAVIQEEVFAAAPRLNLSQLHDLLKHDFAGQEEVRQRFLNKYPKYGNADARVDQFVQQTMDFVSTECAKYRMRLNAPFVPGAFCWIMHEHLGTRTGATPDGRSRGFPFADGSGPAQGREKGGPTAAILSVTSWDAAPLIGGSAFNMKFPKTLFDNPESVGKVQELILTFLRRGGFETQINVVDQAVLLEARQHPEKYADLVVRIGGYTDYFVRLNPEMQDEVIARTGYGAL
jgi:formate C-acetyltransferase